MSTAAVILVVIVVMVVLGIVLTLTRKPHQPDTSVARPGPLAPSRHKPVTREVSSGAVALPDGMGLGRDNVLYVAHNKRTDSRVMSAIARLRKQYPNLSVRYEDYETVAHHRRDSDIRNLSVEIRTDAIETSKKLFADAVRKRASDIHIRVHETHADLFLRIHGALTKYEQMAPDEARRVCAVIYATMADVSDKTYSPDHYQDARIANKEYIPTGAHGIRVASGPTVTGTNMVLRVLYEDVENNGVTLGERLLKLGYNEPQVRDAQSMQDMPTGIIIISGPTGSGKSTTLKHALEAIHLAHDDLDVLTVEDPPEYPIHGVVQMPVTNAETEEDRHREFTGAIRAAMRMDPDIIMIGEIRDGESARLALRAAMTGHQVWTTLHSNDAFASLLRLEDVLADRPTGDMRHILGDPTIIMGLISQRLVRTLCRHCRRPFVEHYRELPPMLVKRIHAALQDDVKGVYIRGTGCNQCSLKSTAVGIAGRTVVAEVVRTDEDVMRAYREHDIEYAREVWYEKGGRGLRAHVVEKLRAGLIDPVRAEIITGPIQAQPCARRATSTVVSIKDSSHA